MAELYSVGKKPNKKTIDEIIAGLEAMGNYIPDSEVIRRDYRNVLMKEYQEFIEFHEKLKAKQENSENKNDTTNEVIDKNK